MIFPRCFLARLIAFSWLAGAAVASESLVLNSQEYLSMPGLDVMLAHDFYPEGHQGGVGIILNGQRVATNGDVRLSATPGQWQPVPRVGARKVDSAAQEVSVSMSYPDDERHRKGFNPVTYPDLALSYTIRIRPAGEGAAFRICVDLKEPLPAAWAGKVGFNLELYPGILFGSSYQVGDTLGVFPRQPTGPGGERNGEYQLAPLGTGRRLTIAPESDRQRMTIEAVRGGELQLLDGRAQHNNGWFVVRAAIPAGATQSAVEWLVSPNAMPEWKMPPTIQLSQVGYHPKQPKFAVVELDRPEGPLPPLTLFRASPSGLETVKTQPAQRWGKFLRFDYTRFDFSEVTQPGVYVVGFGEQRSNPFRIDPAVYERGVWQPTIEYFLPVQMCHMRVEENYRVWHGLCHLDDALMAPENANHFDGYAQGPSTLTRFKGGEHVPGLNRGGWHDAGDYDLRVESQAETVHGLALAWELFRPGYDNTTIDQTARLALIHRPDGKPDLLQQVEHGALSIVGGYQALGRLYRGLQDASLKQYTHLGDPATMTDNDVFPGDSAKAVAVLAEAARAGDQGEPRLADLPRLGSRGSADDRWVFTEENPAHEFTTCAALAAAARALAGYNDDLAAECRRIAVELWSRSQTSRGGSEREQARAAVARVAAAVELLQSTQDPQYGRALIASADVINARVDRAGWLGARALALVQDDTFRAKIRTGLEAYRDKIRALEKDTPYGVPYEPQIWGAAWEIQRFGVQQYFLHVAAPDLFPSASVFRALDFLLGCHPGANPASFVSGVGAKSMTVAYGVNRADWSYVPGGIASGTALIRPDFPELLEWPYLWQQAEYCLGRPTSDYVFLVLAAKHLLDAP